MKTDKSLGQHWLSDESAIQDIVDAIDIVDTDSVLEIGPGLGVLTKPLLQRNKQVVAVELDRRLFEHLQNNLAPNYRDLTLIQGSFLELPLDNLLKLNGHVVGNIPYNITKPILSHIVEHVEYVEFAHLLMQREVAERIADTKSSKLQILVGWFYHAKKGVIIPPEAFQPPPKVDSQLLVLQRRARPLVSREELNNRFKWVRIGFASKRKMLAKNLLNSGLFNDRKEIEELLQEHGLKMTVRAEQISVEQWADLSKYLVIKSSKKP